MVSECLSDDFGMDICRRWKKKGREGEREKGNEAWKIATLHNLGWNDWKAGFFFLARARLLNE